MILLDGDKKVKELKGNELLAYEIMKTICFATKGVEADKTPLEVDFRETSNFGRAAKYLMLKFDIKIKKMNLAKKDEPDTIIEE